MPSSKYTLAVVSLLLCTAIFLTGCGGIVHSRGENGDGENGGGTVLVKSAGFISDFSGGDDVVYKGITDWERPTGKEYEKAEKVDPAESNRVLVDDDAVYRRIEIFGEYASVFCGRRLLDALGGQTVTSKRINDLLAAPSGADANKASERVADYPFYVRPCLVVDKQHYQEKLREVGVLDKNNKPTGKKGTFTVKIRFSTCHDAIIHLLEREIRKDIAGAKVQVMPITKVRLEFDEPKEIETEYVNTKIVYGDLTTFEVTLKGPGDQILSALEEGKIHARYWVPGTYYKRNLSVSSLEILGRAWKSIEEAIKQRDTARTSSSDFYAGLGVQAVAEVVPIKIGLATTDIYQNTSINRWVMKEHLQTICQNIAITANEYRYTEFDGAEPAELKLPDLNSMLNICFPDKKEITANFDPTTKTFSFTPNDDSNLIAEAKEQLKQDLAKDKDLSEDLAKNGIRDQQIFDDSPIKVQLGVDVLSKITRFTNNKSYTFHHVTNASLNTAIKLHSVRMLFQDLSISRRVGPIIVSDIEKAVITNVPVRFDSQTIRGAYKFGGGDARMSRAESRTTTRAIDTHDNDEKTVLSLPNDAGNANKFMLTSSDRCLSKGATTFRLEGDAKYINAPDKKIRMLITCFIEDDNTTYLWSTEIEKKVADPDGTVLGLVNREKRSPSLDGSFSAVLVEQYNTVNSPTFDLLNQKENNINDFFSRAKVRGDNHEIERWKKPCTERWHFHIFSDKWHWAERNICRTFDEVLLSITPHVVLRVETQPQRYTFGRPQPAFKFVYNNETGTFQEVQ